MRTTDVFPAYNLVIASHSHHSLIDLVAACRGPRESAILRLRLNGATQADIAAEVGFSQASVSRKLYDLMERAESSHLGLRLRGRREQTVPTKPKKGGLRYAKHTPGHIGCCQVAA